MSFLSSKLPDTQGGCESQLFLCFSLRCLHRDLNFKWNLNELKANLSHSPIAALEIPSGRLCFLDAEDLVSY